MSQEFIQDNINKQLLVATFHNDSDRIQMLLDAGADINAKNKDGYTALIVAAEQGHLLLFDLLLNAGANVDAKENVNGYTALIWAVDKDRKHIIHLLFDRGSREGPHRRRQDAPRQGC
mgnify:CR=1 FL=1